MRPRISTYFIVLVLLIHATLTLGLSDDLTRVLHDDLVGLETAVAPHAVSTIRGLENLNTNAESTTLLGTLSQILECAVLAVVLANIAVGVVALIQHDAVLAVLGATIVGLADALRLVILEVISLSPVGTGISDEAI